MKDFKKDVKDILDSKKFLWVMTIIGILVVISIIFQAGVSVGFRKASFGRDWGKNYGRNFGMMMDDNAFFGMSRGGMIYERNFPNAHGSVGKILKIELPSIIVSDKDGTEKVVLIKDDTLIRIEREDLKTSDLKVDDYIVVIGSPNESGQIEAKLIRVMPAGIPEFPEKPIKPGLQ